MLFKMDKCIKNGNHENAITLGNEVREIILNNENFFSQKCDLPLLSRVLSEKDNQEQDLREMYDVLIEFYEKAII